MGKMIAVVEDEKDIADLVAFHLSNAGFSVRVFASGGAFLSFLGSGAPALLILDLMLPDADGIEICKHLKREERFSSIPVIILTARAGEADRVLGLELGADDYVVKPFSPRELVARVKAVLRREEMPAGQKRVSIGKHIILDPGRHEVTVDGKRVDMTSTEFRILHILASKQGWVFSRDKILDLLWGNEKAVIDRTVDVHVTHLREKLGSAGRCIANVRGIGYKIGE